MRFLRQWLPVAVWAALILSTSNDSFSSTQSGSWLDALFGGHAPWLLNMAARKATHIIGYGILGLLAWRAHRTMTVTLVVALVVASTDECLQSRTALRSGSGWDVVLDVCAAFVCVATVARGRRSRNVTAGGVRDHTESLSSPPPC